MTQAGTAAAPGVSVRVAGGLGNQMFQYAAARALALRLGVPLTLDLSFYDRRRHRAYGLHALPLAPHTERGLPSGGRLARWGATLSAAARRLVQPGVAVYREPSSAVDEAFFALQAPVHLVGHFQSARYFESAAERLQQELRPAPAADAFSLSLARRMTAEPSVALHVRRGDYLSNPKNRALFACPGAAYYAAALERLPPGCTVFVFSDDMAWSRAHLAHPGHQFVFVDDGQPRPVLADLWLMQLARHHVIANSSLSWWGAWLAKRGQGQDPAQGLSIAPRQWYVAADHDDRDLVPPGWLRL
jgi:hypothetical protein